MTQLRRTAATAAAFDLECELLSPEEALRALPGHAGRRPRRRDLAARRRQGQPDRPDRRAGQGRPAARRPDLRAHPRARRARRGRARSPASAPTPATSRPRSSSTAPASGPRRSARWPASTCRCTRPSTSTSSPTRSRACTPTCRCCATPTATPTSRRRSAAWSSAGSSPTRSRGCRPTRSPTRSSSRCSRRTGSTSRSLMENAVHRVPALEETGIRKFYNGPESFTPDNQFILGEAPEVRGLLRRRRLQLGRHRHGRRGRPRAGGVDRRGRADHGPDQRRRPPVRARSTATTSGCTTGSPRCSGCTTRSRGPTARCAPRGRSAARPLYAHLVRGQRQLRQQDGLGARQLLRARRARRRTIEYSWGKQNWLPWTAAEHANTRENVTVFDQTSFSKYRLVGPDAEAALQWLCTADVAVPGRADRLHRHAQRARHLRVRRDPDPRRRRRVPHRQQRRDHRARPGPHPAARSATAAPRSSTSPRSTPCSA